MEEFLANRAFWSGFTGWFVAQFIKIVINIIKNRRFDFFWIITTGGMPSSHAGGVCALATSIAHMHGVGSSIFAFSVGFAVVVMFDAQTSRRSIGKQARILNNILDDLYAGRPIPDKKIKEFMGHTPFEVLVGAFIGIIVGFILN